MTNQRNVLDTKKRDEYIRPLVGVSWKILFGNSMKFNI